MDEPVTLAEVRTMAAKAPLRKSRMDRPLTWGAPRHDQVLLQIPPLPHRLSQLSDSIRIVILIRAGGGLMNRAIEHPRLR